MRAGLSGGRPAQRERRALSDACTSGSPTWTYLLSRTVGDPSLFAGPRSMPCCTRPSCRRQGGPQARAQFCVARSSNPPGIDLPRLPVAASWETIVSAAHRRSDGQAPCPQTPPRQARNSCRLLPPLHLPVVVVVLAAACQSRVVVQADGGDLGKYRPELGQDKNQVLRNFKHYIFSTFKCI